MSKSETRCPTVKCKEAIEKWGAHYHSVHDIPPEAAPSHTPEAVALCERCGGYSNGKEWRHICKMCGTTVEPGQLKGFFVPHRCAACDEKVVSKERAEGKICRLCNSVYAYCCC